MKYGDIRFYDENFTLLLVVPRYISANWQLNFKEYGTAEIHLEKSPEIVKLLTEHPHLFLVQEEFRAVVTGMRIDKDCAIFARTPEWLLKKFVVSSFSTGAAKKNKELINTNASEVAICMVKKFLPDSVAILAEGTDQDMTDRASFVISEATDLYSAILACLTDEKVGFSFSFDPEQKTFLFSILKAKENNKLSLSDENKTSYDLTYTFDLQEQTEGYVYYRHLKNGGKWDPASNTPTLSVTPQNYGMYYTATDEGSRFGLEIKKGDFLVCTDKRGFFRIADNVDPYLIKVAPKTEGIFSWSTVLSAKNETEANRELQKKKEEKTISCKMKKLSYQKDFSLGDILCVQFVCDDFVFAQKQMINGIHLWDEAGNAGAMPQMSQLADEI